jgi:methylase of polypeptide subunit release factors
LFECLDKQDTDGNQYFLDGFSRNPTKAANGNFKHRAFIPNCLFFDEEKGIIPLLKRYNFTVEENAPNEVQVALDPELLGKVFENLLGAFNPETKETARKQSGSFYTPREIVDYMVNESLINYLQTKLPNLQETEVRDLFENETPTSTLLNDSETCKEIANQLKAIKILDPACGSGAFPMGILSKMVEVLEKLGATNQSIHDLKLHLIEECIYGIDIQTIATQISKLRFFITLVVEQNNIDLTKPNDNYGVLTLPNLETKFVSANTLIGIKKKKAGDFVSTLFTDSAIDDTKQQLLNIRHEHFYAKTAGAKKRLREQDALLRDKLAKLLEENKDFAPTDALQLSQWNPYDQNTSSPFFDTEWMFGLKEGFDIVIGNPPYRVVKKKKQAEFKSYITVKSGELYSYFFEKSISSLLNKNGIISFITASLFIRGLKFETLRKYLENNTSIIELKIQGDDIFSNVQMPTATFIGKKNKSKTWGFEDFNPNLKLIRKIKSEYKTIKEISNVMRGFEIGRNKTNSKGDIKFITGSDIKKWKIKNFRYISNETFQSYKKNDSFFIGDRVLIRETGSSLTSLFINDKLYSNRSLYNIKIIDKNYSAKYVTALLNSKLLQFYYSNKFKTETDIFPKIRIVQVNELPICNCKETIQLKISALTEFLEDDMNEDKINSIELEIDKIIYKLYNLTHQEVLVIDPAFSLSQEAYNKYQIT